MKQLKIICSIILILSLLPFVTVSAVEGASVKLVETKNYKKLEAFGVINSEDKLNSLETISRGIFTDIIMRCFKNLAGDVDMSLAENPYTDVDDATIGYNAIITAQALGFIDSTPGSLFRPEDSIKREEAAKIICNVFNYGEIAKYSGGYPNGYFAIINKLGIFKGCTFNSDGSLSPESFLKILMNMMDTPILKTNAVVKNKDSVVETYENDKNETLLNYAFDIYEADGVMESNGYTSFYGPSPVGEEFVVIAGEEYRVKDVGMHENIGYFCEFYYKYNKEADEKEIVYIEISENRNEITEVDSDDICVDSVNTSTYVYFDNYKNKNISHNISKAAVMIYNGKQKRLSKEDICPTNGSVILIDNNGDKVVDVIKVMNYRVILVGGMSSSSYSITDLLGGTNIELSPEEKDYRVFLSENNKDAEFGEIEIRDVLSYAESNDGKLKYVKISSEKVIGAIQEIADDAVTINGKEYDVEKSLMSQINLGTEGTFYLDFKGKIVAKKSENDVVYGYLNRIDKSNKLRNTVLVQIFTENNRWVELELKDKIKFGTQKGYKAELFYDLCTETLEDYRQLITYTVNDEGKINYISLPQSFEKWSDAENNAIEQDVFRLSATVNSATYRSALKSFGNTITLRDDTKIFMVPQQEKGVYADEEEFYTVSASELLADRTYSNIYAYDMDKMRCAGACVLVGNPRMIQGSSNIMIIDKMVKMANENGEFVDAIRGMYKGYMLTLCVEDETVLAGTTNLGKGDIIQFALNNEGSICVLEQCYDYISGNEKDIIKNNLYNTSGKICGKVYFIDESKRFILDVANDEAEKAILGTNSSTKVYVYDTENNEITMGNLTDVEIGKRAFARTRYYIADEVVVYR